MNTNPQNSTQAAGLPSSQAVSDFQFGEQQNFLRQWSDCIQLNVPANLQRRKLYCWLWGDANVYQLPSPFFVAGHITFKSNGSPLGTLPMSIGPSGSFGTSTGITSSVPTICGAGGASVGDSLLVNIGNPLSIQLPGLPAGDTVNQPSQVLLQPFNFSGQFDTVTLSVDAFSPATYQSDTGYWTGGVLGIRAFMAMVSTQG
jgi:hypothetical protein